ncbi:MAG: hypothetical protein FWG64_02110 [Firmicutes bacterium]|nr:hypothetical protein [Bacillota bacterium]
MNNYKKTSEKWHKMPLKSDIANLARKGRKRVQDVPYTHQDFYLVQNAQELASYFDWAVVSKRKIINEFLHHDCVKPSVNWGTIFYALERLIFPKEYEQNTGHSPYELYNDVCPKCRNLLNGSQQ